MVTKTRRFSISVDAPPRDWQGLQRKISLGASLQDAAEVSGIPLDEAIAYATKKLENRELVSFELKLIAEQSLAVALKTLVEIAQGGQRTSSESIGPGMMSHQNSDDLEAAKTLAKVAIDALKLGFGPRKEINVKAGKGSLIQMDLWDSPGPWQLKKPGS